VDKAKGHQIEARWARYKPLPEGHQIEARWARYKPLGVVKRCLRGGSKAQELRVRILRGTWMDVW
jgi:hypothetical protein